MIQKICDMAGKYGCLVFSYLYCIGIDGIEAVKMYDKLVAKKIIREDFYVLDGNKLLSAFGSTRRVVRLGHTPTGRLYIQKWHNNKTNHSHYVVMKNGDVVYDPIGESVTCKDGFTTDDIREVK